MTIFENDIHVINTHCEGEIGDVIVGGVTPPPGDSLWDMRNWIEKDNRLRQYLLNEPRGSLSRHVNLLVPPKSKQADAAFIIMEPADTPPMSGSNTICVTTVLLERGIIPMVEPVTEMTLEVPAGLINVKASCENGKVLRVIIENVASFADQLNTPVEIEKFGTIKVDTAYGGDSFVIVDAKNLGFSLTPDEGRDLVETGIKLTHAANEQLGFKHPLNPEWRHISFCQFTHPIVYQDDALHGKSAVIIQPGKIDRSPTGTGCSARMALLSAQGKMKPDDRFIGTSIIDTAFDCKIKQTTMIKTKPAIIPIISGRAWIIGQTIYNTIDDDPFPLGYRISDTWPDRYNR